MIHIHNPTPSNIIDGSSLRLDDHPTDRFGRILLYTNGCCRKDRVASNCIIKQYEWYQPLVVCKDGKGCKR